MVTLYQLNKRILGLQKAGMNFLTTEARYWRSCSQLVSLWVTKGWTHFRQQSKTHTKMFLLEVRQLSTLLSKNSNLLHKFRRLNSWLGSLSEAGHCHRGKGKLTTKSIVLKTSHGILGGHVWMLIEFHTTLPGPLRTLLLLY